jgi:hypothetical protein
MRGRPRDAARVRLAGDRFLAILPVTKGNRLKRRRQTIAAVAGQICDKSAKNSYFYVRTELSNRLKTLITKVSVDFSAVLVHLPVRQ